MPSYPIQLKRSGTAAAAPSSLAHGELALNYADGLVYWKDSSNTIRNFSLVAGVPASPSFTGNSTFTASSGVPVVITNTGTDLSFRVNDESGDTSPFVVDAAGNVGIGTSTVSANMKLDVRGAALFYRTTSDGLVTVQGLQTSSGGTGKAAIQIDVNGQGGFAWQCDATGTKTLRLINNGGYGASETTLLTVTSAGVLAVGGNAVLHAGNYTSYSPTLTGTGASGTWGISVTGSAAQLGGVAASNYFRVDGSYPNADMNVPVEGYWHVAPNASNLPDGARYGHRWDYDHAGDGIWVAQFYTPTDGDAGLWFRQRRGGTWQAWRKFLDSTTYNSYSPTLTGGGASGTWGINVSGELTGTSIGLGYSLSTATVSYAGHAGPQIRSQGGGAAVMSFHRPGAYAVNFGLDTDNQLKVGGWSLGANSYVILSSANYNSYSPTLTGGGASGTWSISVTGSAGSATTCTYQVGSGTANNFTTNFNETPAHNRAFREMSAGGPQGAWWFVENMRHSNGTNYWGRQNAWGWEDNANEFWSRNVTANSWGSWVRFIHSGNYNSYAPTLTGGGASGTWGISVTGTANSETLATVTGRGAETNSIVQSNASVRAPIFYDSQNTAYYCDPNGTSRMAGMDIDSLQIYGNHLYVGKGDTAAYSYIHMRDSDEGERLIHCNSNRIGFLSQAGAWSAWSYDDGTFGCYGGTSRAIEAVGGWGSFGATLEVRCDNWAGNGQQDGPRIWHHKAGVKSWTIGIQHAASNGFSINEDGSWGGFGTERLVIAPGGAITHNGVPGYFVRAWAYFYNASRYGSGNVSSITSRSATGKYRINFETPLPSGNPCCLGNVGNESDTIANTTMRMGVRSFASGARLATQDINIVISGGQGVPAASDAMIGCSFLAII